MNKALIASVTVAVTVAACQPTPSPTPASTPTALPIITTIFPTAPPPPPPTPTPAPEPLYLNLTWHQHQPLYYPDPQTGLITRPWVRVHATKDYYDMAATLQQYPKVKATFNLTPVLIKQLDDLANGARDVYWELGAKPAASLTDDERRFILTRFFDVNAKNIVSRFPRFEELAGKRGGGAPEQIEAALQSFSEQDIRDLQVWFNLAWFDPDFLEQSPLQELVAKGRDFTEGDKPIVFNKALEIIRGVIPLHRAMQDAGQIEVITTPYAHPILPLLVTTNLQRAGDPKAVVPEPPFVFPVDATEHVSRSVAVYKQHYGREPRGLWPGEGAVAAAIVPGVAGAGYAWMATGEQVLAKTLGIDSFARDGDDTVQQADKLYRPYVVDVDGAKVAMVFRDLRLSDLIGFEYSGVDGELAAQDLIDRLLRVRAQLKEEGAKGPHLVSIILDGENAWENYPNDGKAFFHALYRKLSEASDKGEIETITPSAYLERFPNQQTLNDLWPGAWFSPDYSTWIGEPEENEAWRYLRRTRRMLDDYLKGAKPAEQAALDKAYDAMLYAQGSDWFWWYGGDQDSGDDGYFDRGFRALLREVYEALAVPLPEYVGVPIISAGVAKPDQTSSGIITPTIDGAADTGEWDLAGAVRNVGGVQGRSENPVAALFYGINDKALVLRLDANDVWATLAQADPSRPLRVGVYVKMPAAQVTAPLSQLGPDDKQRVALGMNASHVIEWLIDGVGVSNAVLHAATGDGAWDEVAITPNSRVTSAMAGATVEMSVPLAGLGGIDSIQAGDAVRLVALVSQGGRALGQFPVNSVAQMTVPDLKPATILATVDDPAGDDTGPGTYTYPQDGVFEKGVYDLKRMSVARDGDSLIFTLQVNGPINNPWGSGIGLSVQTFDLYIDKDPGKGTGRRLLLEGRNAALPKEDGWDYAVWVEGWNQQVLKPDEDGNVVEAGTAVRVLIDPTGKATIRVPLDALGDGDPTEWGYAVAVLSQEGFPAAGVRRVRDVEQAASQWKAGGAPDDVNHTRIFDVLSPGDASPSQADGLGDYTPSKDKSLNELTADDFGVVRLLRLQ